MTVTILEMIRVGTVVGKDRVMTIAQDVGDDVVMYIDRWAADKCPDYGERLLIAGSYSVTGTSENGEIILEIRVPKTLMIE